MLRRDAYSIRRARETTEAPAARSSRPCFPALGTSSTARHGGLEQEFGDLQEFEFTVQDGRLFLLQARVGKRTPQAAARIALDLMDEGLISAEIARTRTAGLDTGALT